MPRGRPAYKPTAATRDKVAGAAGGGMSHEDIALALGIHRDTLEKHFALELTVGAYRKRMEVVEAIRKAAKKGNMGAARLYLQVEPQLAVPPQPEDQAKPEKSAPAKDEAVAVEKVGKKEQAQLDAVNAHSGTDWETLLRPDRQRLQ